jgi:hypothetical protein
MGHKWGQQRTKIARELSDTLRVASGFITRAADATVGTWNYLEHAKKTAQCKHITEDWVARTLVRGTPSFSFFDFFVRRSPAPRPTLYAITCGVGAAT